MFNGSWTGCVDIESILLRSWTKNSTLIMVSGIVGHPPVVGWVRTWWEEGHGCFFKF